MPQYKHWPDDLRKTAIRLAIYRYLAKSDRPRSALDILDALKAESVPSWLSSVYRNLEALEAHHLIRRLHLPGNEQAFYEAETDSHLHYARCLNCQAMIPLEHCPVEAFSSELRAQGFALSGHRIELYGLCTDCQNKSEVRA